jgi:hypothetical protein
MAHCGLGPNEAADRTGVENPVRAQASAHKQVGAVNRGRLGASMAQDKHPFGALSAIEQNMEKARGAMDNYFSFLQNTMSFYPWGSPDLIEEMKTYTDQNISASVECVNKLSRVKDFQEVFRIQTEFMQTQLNSLTEQARSLGDAYTKAATRATKMMPFGTST